MVDGDYDLWGLTLDILDELLGHLGAERRGGLSRRARRALRLNP